MNTVTRMILIPEDQYRRGHTRPTPIKRILNKNLPYQIKLNMLNHPKKKEDALTKFLDLLTKSIEKKPDVQSKAETPRMDQSSIGQESYYQDVGEVENLAERSIIPPAVITSTPKPSKKLPDPIVPSTLLQFPDNSPKHHNLITKELENKLRSIPNLVNTNNQVLKDHGEVIRRSNVAEIVSYLRTKSPKTRAPDGYAYVISKIAEHPSIDNLILNKNTLESLKHQRPSTSQSEWSDL